MQVTPIDSNEGQRAVFGRLPGTGWMSATSNIAVLAVSLGTVTTTIPSQVTSRQHVLPSPTATEISWAAAGGEKGEVKQEQRLSELKERYRVMGAAPWFKRIHENKDLGNVVAVE